MRRQDDFKIKHVKSPMLQYNACLPKLLRRQEYYAYGLQTGTSCLPAKALAEAGTRDNTKNNFLNNGGTELNGTSGVYDLDYRNYDPVLGRMHQVGPLASKYASISPYNYAP